MKREEKRWIRLLASMYGDEFAEDLKDKDAIDQVVNAYDLKIPTRQHELLKMIAKTLPKEN